MIVNLNLKGYTFLCTLHVYTRVKMNNLFPVDIDRHEQDCATPSCRTSCEQCCYRMFSRDNDNVVLNNYIVDNLFLGYSRTLFELVDINHVHEQVFRFYSCRIAHLYTSYNYLHVYCKMMNINATTIGTHKTASNSNNLTTVLLKSTN